MWEQDPDFKSQSCTLGLLVPTVTRETKTAKKKTHQHLRKQQQKNLSNDRKRGKMLAASQFIRPMHSINRVTFLVQVNLQYNKQNLETGNKQASTYEA